MPLPKKGTAEWENLVKIYLKATRAEREKLASQLGFAHIESLGISMRRRGVRITEPEVPPISIDSSSPSPEEIKILSIIKSARAPVSVSELSRQLDRSSETIIKFIDSLRSKHYEVIIDEDSHSVSIPETFSQNFQPTNFNYHRKYYKIGCVSDTHLCSRYQQLTLLHDAYRLFDDEKMISMSMPVIYWMASICTAATWMRYFSTAPRRRKNTLSRIIPARSAKPKLILSAGSMTIVTSSRMATIP